MLRVKAGVYYSDYVGTYGVLNFGRAGGFLEFSRTSTPPQTSTKANKVPMLLSLQAYLTYKGFVTNTLLTSTLLFTIRASAFVYAFSDPAISDVLKEEWLGAWMKQLRNASGAPRVDREGCHVG